jgi:hypothetical protein
MRLGIVGHIREKDKLVETLKLLGTAVLWVMSGPKGLLG